MDLDRTEASLNPKRPNPVKSRWKVILGIFAILLTAATFLLITANQRWKPSFLQSINAKKVEEFTVHGEYGSWTTTRIYRVPGKLEPLTGVIKTELSERWWQWSKTTIQSRSGSSMLTSHGWHINRDNHTFQVEEGKPNSAQPYIRIVWHEHPNPVEAHWNLLRRWLGIKNPKRP